MVWRYVVIDRSASELAGVELGSRCEVVARLESRGCLVVAMEPDLGMSLQSLLSAGFLPTRKLALFFRDFANMISAGLSLDHILAVFKDTGLDVRMAGVCDQLADDLVAGQSLAEAMGRTKVFPRLAVDTVRAGERAGNMPTVMGLLADHFELASELKGKCLGALIYPACVLVFLVAALVYVSEAVVPQLTPLLPAEAMDEPLTKMMLVLSRSVRWSAPLAAGIMGVVVFLAGILARRYPRLFNEMLHGVPVIGSLHKDLAISLCFFDLFILLKSGIPLDTALGDAGASGHGLTGSYMESCREHLRSGHTFSSALAQTRHFPRLVVETMRLGEEMGHYDDHCQRVFRLYYRSFETRVNALVAVLQPMVLGACALFIAAMAFAFLRPIYANLTQMGSL